MGKYIGFGVNSKHRPCTYTLCIQSMFCFFFNFFSFLGKGHSQEDSMHVRGKPMLRFRLSFQRRKQGSSPEGQILNRP